MLARATAVGSRARCSSTSILGAWHISRARRYADDRSDRGSRAARGKDIGQSKGQNKPLAPHVRPPKAQPHGAATVNVLLDSTRTSRQETREPVYSKQQEEFETGAQSKHTTSPTLDGVTSPILEGHQLRTTLSTPALASSPGNEDTPALASSPGNEDEAVALAQSEPSPEPSPELSVKPPVEAVHESITTPTATPLPDLTQGIPSSFAMGASPPGSGAKPGPSNDPLDRITSLSPLLAGGGRGGGELPKSAYISSIDRRKSQIASYAMATFLLLSVGGTLYLGRNWDSSEEEKKHPEAPSGWGPRLFYNRIRARYLETTGYFTEPTFPKLLPDVDPAFERPLTLVLSLDDLLVHSEWTREHGWRMAKRPGVDYFLRYIQQYYELVIFTTMPVVTGEQVIRKLDPYRIVMWPLFREATKYVDGTHVKDLSFLNRDLSKVILMDTDPSHAMLQPENAIILPKWKGDPQDSELVAYIPFLEYVATMGIADARMAIKSFDGKHIPTEYATREAVARKAFEEEMAKERGNRSRRVSKGLLQTFMGPRLASGDGSEQSASEAFEQGKMLQDVMRERGQKQYETLEKELRENGEQWLKEMAAEDEKFRDEQMKDMKSSVFGFLGAAGKPRPKAPSETTK